MFPNPTRSITTIDFGTDFTGSVSVVDVSGKKVLQLPNVTAAQSVQVNLSQMENGLYFLNLRNQEGSSKIIKILKQ